MNIKIITFVLVLFGLVHFGYANETTPVKSKNKKESVELKKVDDTFKRVTCSFTLSVGDGEYTITVSAGNFLTSEENAKRKCTERLQEAASVIVGVNPDGIGINYH